MILPFKHKKPKIHPSVFIAPGAHIIGDVRLDKGVSIWFGAVLRADIAAIRIGEGTNIQDGCVVHVDHGLPCVLKKGIIMGHQATAHACTVEDGVLIGIGARILSGAHVGKFSLIGAGALVLENADIPERSLVLGVPGKVVRQLTLEEIAAHTPHAKRYRELAGVYKKYLG
ncbi:MAG: gamma carbonic anhydrase family protein [Candidatus Omnitrophica bacterium CG1_02_46_14]|nr:MAG: gamma carbonic anhydrase family protein [Candidatus Omnitrophica bacterium CG1_02_46_14]